MLQAWNLWAIYTPLEYRLNVKGERDGDKLKQVFLLLAAASTLLPFTITFKGKLLIKTAIY